MSKLHEQNISRGRLIYEVVYEYRAQAERSDNEYGHYTIRYESGVTTRTIHILGPNPLVVQAHVEWQGKTMKDFRLISCEPFGTQLDAVIKMEQPY